MANWEKVLLKDIVQDFFDGPHATPKESDKGAIFLGIKNITEDGRIDLSDIRYIAMDDLPKWTKRVKPTEGDIVFSYEATLHRYALIPPNFIGCLGRRMALIRINEKVADKYFLFKYMFSPNWKKEVERNILTGATVDRIPLTKVPEFKLYLPPLPIQRRIASILSAYDDLIENNLKRIKLLEESMQIILAKLIKDANSSSDFIYPKIADFDKGFEPGSNNYEEENCDGLIPFFRVGDLSTRDSKLYISSDLKGIKLAQSEDILISMDGSIGIVSIGINGAYSSGIRKVEVKNQLYKGLIYSFLKSPIGQSQIMTYVKGSTILHASSCIPKLNMVLPSEHKFNRELELSNSGLQQIINLIALNKKLKESRDILLPKLMSGKINVV